MKIIKTAFVVMVLVGMLLVMNSAVWAEDPDHTNVLIEVQPFNSYNEYHYPSGGRLFYLPRWHEVKFDVHNGKFFMIAHYPHHDRHLPQDRELELDCKVFFYTPNGKLFGVRRIKNLDKNRYHSIPHNDRSPNYDRLIVKVQNNCDTNKDVKLRILDPIDPVRGTPMKHATFRVIFH